VKLFFDTETTGKAHFGLPVNDPCQPRLVQLAALLTTDDGVDVASINLLVKPDGFAIPEEASAVHGITTDTALGCGVHQAAALGLFCGLATHADQLIAHNIQFDLLVLSHELNRYPAAGQLKPMDEFCTMNAMTPICKLPNRFGYASFKWPKLDEAFLHAFGRRFVGAHDAMNDVRACRDIYFWLQRNGGGK
jgi:DNA polymerase-3 subunit epsilon